MYSLVFSRREKRKRRLAEQLSTTIDLWVTEVPMRNSRRLYYGWLRREDLGAIGLGCLWVGGAATDSVALNDPVDACD